MQGTPCRKVEGTLAKYLRPGIVLASVMMSLVLLVRKKPAFQLIWVSHDLRNIEPPASGQSKLSVMLKVSSA